jgi:hypothetical protein
VTATGTFHRSFDVNVVNHALGTNLSQQTARSPGGSS